MCAIPFTYTANVYFAVVFIDLCKVADSQVSMHLVDGLKYIMEVADKFDPEEFDRLTEWFAHHLSNYRYNFNWHEWNSFAEQGTSVFFLASGPSENPPTRPLITRGLRPPPFSLLLSFAQMHRLSKNSSAETFWRDAVN